MRMLEDGSGNFYDPNFYDVADDAAVMPAFPNINTGTTKTYRRVYRNLQYVASPGKYTADSITATAAVWDPANALTSNAPADIAFLDPTRYNIAKTGAVGRRLRERQQHLPLGADQAAAERPRPGACRRTATSPVRVSDAVADAPTGTPTRAAPAAALGNYAHLRPERRGRELSPSRLRRPGRSW